MHTEAHNLPLDQCLHVRLGGLRRVVAGLGLPWNEAEARNNFALWTRQYHEDCAREARNA